MPRRWIRVAVGVLLSGDSCWIQRRPEGAHLAGFWEFPGGRVREGEDSLHAVLRELDEETGLRLESGQCNLLLKEEHVYEDRRVRLDFFLCRLDSRPDLGGGCWVSLNDLEDYSFPPANRNVLSRLRRMSTR